MKRTAADRRRYITEDALVLGAYQASILGGKGTTDVAEIERRARCSHRIAARVAHLQRHAAPAILELWKAGNLTTREAERIALDDADDEASQVASAARRSSLARQALAREERRGGEQEVGRREEPVTGSRAVDALVANESLRAK